MRPLHAGTGAKVLEQLLTRHLLDPHPAAKNFLKTCIKAVDWRKDVLHSEVVEHVFRKRMQDIVDPLFYAYADPCSANSGWFLDLEGWFAMLDALEVLPCEGPEAAMNLWDRTWIWQASVMWQVDELTFDMHLKISFVEYIEALARLVLLLRGRKEMATATQEELDRVEYGLGAPCASVIFNLASEGLNSAAFAGYLDAFLSSPQVKKGLTARPKDESKGKGKSMRSQHDKGKGTPALVPAAAPSQVPASGDGTAAGKAETVKKDKKDRKKKK